MHSTMLMLWLMLKRCSCSCTEWVVGGSNSFLYIYLLAQGMSLVRGTCAEHEPHSNLRRLANSLSLSLTSTTINRKDKGPKSLTHEVECGEARDSASTALGLAESEPPPFLRSTD